MKHVKMILSTLTILSIVSGGSLATTSAHAVGVAFYQFTQWSTYSGSGAATMVSNSWTSSSSNNTVLIQGWQNNGDKMNPANFDYEVVESVWYGWSPNWVLWHNNGNYPSNGAWYDHRFDGIPNGKTIAIRLTVQTPVRSDGAGNAYQTN